ncbi:MAG: agmatine deiminase family protein [Bacteroidaceae bacterium]|nr:agmatine deiminase family protein [Bacteroidaceae bacterium]
MALQYRLTTTTIEDLTLELRPEQMAGPEQSEIRATHMPAEWARQSGVQLTWPHKGTDWAPILKEVTECYIRMALEISLRERLIVVTPEPEAVDKLLQERLPKRALENISIHEMPTDDTWARDHGFISLVTNMGSLLLDFQFNGWGRKFPADEDNRINRRLMDTGVLHGQYEDHLDFVLEGGSIESDGKGTILTTSQCLLAPNRNQNSGEGLEDCLKRYLRAERVLWLDYGHLAGDDTDGHIDTLARFCPNDTIAYVQCTDESDEHYANLKKMEEQLLGFRTTEGEPYRLIPLPMAAPAYDETGLRLPATYANFLIINGAVLMPTYGNEERDERAQRQLQLAFPKHEIVGIDSRTLIQQHGSIHCSAMQFPMGVIKK